jgi:ACS family tartrate transporter-like MFS transporter
VALLAFCLAAMGLWSTMGPFWALTTRTLEGAAAAGGVAMITMLGGIGGFTGPYLTGRLKDATHSFAGGLYGMAALAMVAALLAMTGGGARQPMSERKTGRGGCFDEFYKFQPRLKR